MAYLVTYVVNHCGVGRTWSTYFNTQEGIDYYMDNWECTASESYMIVYL